MCVIFWTLSLEGERLSYTHTPAPSDTSHSTLPVWFCHSFVQVSILCSHLRFSKCYSQLRHGINMTFSSSENLLCSLQLIIALLLCLVFCVVITRPPPDCSPVVKIFSPIHSDTSDNFWTLFSVHQLGSIPGALHRPWGTVPGPGARSLFAESHTFLFLALQPDFGELHSQVAGRGKVQGG